MFPYSSLEEILSFEKLLLLTYSLSVPVMIGGGFLVHRTDTSRGQKYHLFAASLLFLVGAAFYFPYTNDDALIFSRFAVHLAEGNGPVYNLGERVEGFTSPLWVALVAASSLISSDVIVTAKVMGVILALLAVLSVYGVCYELSRDRHVAFSCAAILSMSQLFQSWSGSGMDVALFVLWVCGTSYAALKREGIDVVLVATTGIGFFLRPEAYIVAFVLWSSLLFSPYGKGKRIASRSFMVHLGAVIAIGLLPFALRWIYYGELLPNTFYAKSSRSLVQGVWHIVKLTDNFGWAFMCCACIGLWTLRRRVLWIPLSAAAFGVYFIAVGGDVLSLRFSLFAYPFLLMGLSGFLLVFERSSFPSRWLVSVLLCLFFGVHSIFQMSEVLSNRYSQHGHLYVPNNSIGTFEADYHAGMYLARTAKEGERLATDNIGAAGYFADLKVLDTYGLVSRDVAKSIFSGDPEEIRTMLERYLPEYILCNVKRSDGGERWWLAWAGDITDWAKTRYVPLKHWESVTGYARVLLQRR
jgi:hypothetical protein